MTVNLRINESAAAISALLYLTGYGLYIRSALRGLAKPSQASWAAWSFADVMVTLSLFKAPLVPAPLLVQPLVLTGGAVAVLAVSLKYGKWGVTRWDIWCVIASVLSAALLYGGEWVGLNVRQQSISGLLLGILAIVIAATPTVVGAYHKPHEESLAGWVLYLLGSIAALGTVAVWSPNLWWQPLFAILDLCLNGLLVYLCLRTPAQTQTP